MNRLEIANQKVNEGVNAFYRELDEPHMRISNDACVQTIYKVTAITGFYFATWIYVGWKTVIE